MIEQTYPQWRIVENLAGFFPQTKTADDKEWEICRSHTTGSGGKELPSGNNWWPSKYAAVYSKIEDAKSHLDREIERHNYEMERKRKIAASVVIHPYP